MNNCERGVIQEPYSRSQLEQLIWSNTGLLANFIAQRLAISQANFIHPSDLTNCGLAAYAGDQVVPFEQTPGAYVNEILGRIRPEQYQRIGMKPAQLRNRYLEFIGHGDYRRSVITQALKEAPKKISIEEAQNLEISLAVLAAEYFKFDPSRLNSMPNPTLRIDPVAMQIKGGVSDIIYPLFRKPRTVMEFGPGISAAKKITQEISQTDLTVLVDKSPYVCHILDSLAMLNGLRTQADRGKIPQVLIQPDGIKAATNRFTQAGANNSVDVILASMIHSAGKEEVKAGIENGYRLLSSGGLLIIQAPHFVKTGEVDVTETLAMARSAFGEPVTVMSFRTIQQATGQKNKAEFAVFAKQ